MSFTKLIVCSVMICFLWGVVLGSYIALQDYQYIDNLLVYLGITTPAVIAFYVWKAKHENIHKFPSWKDHNVSD